MQDTQKPTFSLEDLKEIEADDAQIEQEVNGDIARGDAAMRKAGMSEQEIARARSRPVDEETPEPTPSLSEIALLLRDAAKPVEAQADI